MYCFCGNPFSRLLRISVLIGVGSVGVSRFCFVRFVGAHENWVVVLAGGAVVLELAAGTEASLVWGVVREAIPGRDTGGICV